jgi:UDP-glucose 4-epimerase
MRVAVTGGAGFIGSHIVDRLLTLGVSVSVIDDFSTGGQRNLWSSNIEYMEGSILDAKALEAALHGADAVVHLAAIVSVAESLAHSEKTHEVNATGTLRVLEASRRLEISKFVLASSSAVYGSMTSPPHAESLSVRPSSPYAASKASAEAYAIAYANSFAMDTLVLRMFNVYGPRQRVDALFPPIVPAFIRAALTGTPVEIFGDGQQTRDFTYVEDVAEVICRSTIEDRTLPSPMNLAFGGSISILELRDTVERLTGRSIAITQRPARSGEVRHSLASTELLKECFPDVTPREFSEGLEATIAWTADLLNDPE